jgi:hypothetical protein
MDALVHIISMLRDSKQGLPARRTETKPWLDVLVAVTSMFPADLARYQGSRSVVMASHAESQQHLEAQDQCQCASS